MLNAVENNTVGTHDAPDGDGLFIDGKWLPASNGATFEDINPTTRQSIARLPNGTVADMDRAIAAAVSAQSAWAQMLTAARAEFFYKAIDVFARRQQEFCRALIQET